jgi:predicted dehydrogenase/aryl-alcohol dehydrogenase-like predicted oxidoreductase
MTKKLKWGIIGPGGIAAKFARGVGWSRRSELAAVASRSQERADAFGDEHGIPHRYGAYEELLDDDSVEAVYIATPHPQHSEWVIRCAEAGKHILCEKPVTINAWEAMAVIEAAHRHDVFFMEAFMYRCSPQTARLVSLIREQAVGEVQAIEAGFSYRGDDNTQGRHLNHELAGGGILDVGGYCTSIARLVAGVARGGEIAEPDDLHAVGTLHEKTGVDVSTTALLKFPGEIMASLTCGTRMSQPNVVRVWGTEGWLEVPQPWFCQGQGVPGGTSRILVHRNGEPKRVVKIQTSESLYGNEADHVARNLRRRQGQFPAMTWDDTIKNLKVMDRWRDALGLVYDHEKPHANTPVSGRPLGRRRNSFMVRRTLEGLEKPVSLLCMGSMHGDTRQSMAVWDEYIEAGGNTIDTAFIYRTTDTRLGQWMQSRGVRDEVVVLAKGAHTPNCNPEALTRQLEQTLEALQTDHVDLYFMHRDNLEVPVSEFVDVLNEHVNAGRIRVFGGSNWTRERLEEANRYAAAHGKHGFRALSNHFSLAELLEVPWEGCISSTDSEWRNWLEEKQFPLFSWSSQAMGFFVSEVAGPDKPGYRFREAYYNEENFERQRRAIQLAEKRKVVPTAIALAYALQQPFPLFALFCPHTPHELTTSLEALKIELTPEEMRWLNLEETPTLSHT